ncbi:MAG: hypothetical protein GF320_10655 [Armatimonadia bacterium]|nr:hypothetical protein [Armatimonadia bacterium]
MKRAWGRQALMLLAALTMLSTAAWAQDAIVIKHQMQEDEVRGIDVASHQEGTMMGQPQTVEGTATIVARARDVAEDGFTEDLYTVNDWLRIETPAGVLDTSQGDDALEGAGMGGAGGDVITQRVDWHGYALAADDVPVTSDPTAALTQELRSAMGHLPAEPVAPGDTWSDHATVQVADGSAQVTVDWRFDRVAEIDGRRYAILVGDAEAIIENLQLGRKEERATVQGQQIHRYVDEFVEFLEISQVIELQWDIEAGYAPTANVDQVMSAVSLLTVTDIPTDTVVATDFRVEVEREGSVQVTTREPTDEEVALIVPEAVGESITRMSPALLETLLAPDYDATDILQSMNAYFANYQALRGSVDDAAVELDGDAGMATFTLAVSGAQAQVGAGADVTEMQPIYEAPMTLSLTRSGDLWLIDGIEVGQG